MKSHKLGYYLRRPQFLIILFRMKLCCRQSISLQSTESFGLEAPSPHPVPTVKNQLQVEIMSGLCTDSYLHHRS